MANKLREQLLIVALCLHGLPTALLADPQRTTASFTTNGAQSTAGQQQSAQSPMATMGMDTQNYQAGTGAFYRQDVLPPGVGYPGDQNYFIGGGFNKGFGLRVPDALSGAGYYNSNMHSPLGELWAVKADLIPAIFKTGLVVAVLIVIFKIVAFLVYAKKSALVGAGAAMAGLGAPVAPVSAIAPGPVPVVSVLAERSRSAGTATDESSNKIKREASPVVDARTDFDAMLAQLESIRAHFEETHQD